jgi:hypothetical protein
MSNRNTHVPSPIAFALIRSSRSWKDHPRACHRPTSWLRGLRDKCQVRENFFPYSALKMKWKTRSDARTGSIVEDKIKPALESGSGIRSTKPVLLVIDEIDGATGTEVNIPLFCNSLAHGNYRTPVSSVNLCSSRKINQGNQVCRSLCTL